jgi:hypothetical protein
MGAPTFIFSEIFLQYTDHTSILKILNHHKIVGYYRYVDDICIIYHKKITEIKNALEEINII